MNEDRLREILAEEFEKAEGLPPQAAAHIAKIRSGPLTPGLQAVVDAMQRAIDEDRDPLA
jgi:hypothetical protein